MRNYVFAVEMHEDYGALGFRPKWIPMADPVLGAAVAHDILEHGPKDDGSTEAECMALGSMLYVRGDNSYWSQTGNMHPEWVHIGSDFPQLLGFHRERGCGAIRRCPQGTRDKDLQERIDAALHQGRKFLREEREGGNDTTPFTPDDIIEMGRWIGHGYRRAERRYRKIGSGNVCSMFMQIEKRADELLNHAEEGMELTVRLDLPRHHMTAYVDYVFDEYN